jgi:hypothetical protein
MRTVWSMRTMWTMWTRWTRWTRWRWNRGIGDTCVQSARTGQIRWARSSVQRVAVGIGQTGSAGRGIDGDAEVCGKVSGPTGSRSNYRGRGSVRSRILAFGHSVVSAYALEVAGADITLRCFGALDGRVNLTGSADAETALAANQT